MKGTRLLCLFVFVFSVFVLNAAAKTISPNINEFAVFAGGKLDISRQVGISGDIGSGSDMWINTKSKIDGSIYSGGKFSVGSEVSASGRIIASGNVGIGPNANLFSIDSGGSMYIGNGSKVGALSANRDLQISRYVSVKGNVGANGRVSVNSNSNIHGDVTYGTRYWISPRSTVDGEILRGETDVDNWSVEKRIRPHVEYGSESIYYRAHTDNVLEPGDYRSLSVDRGAVLKLSAGTYNFAKVWLDDEVQIIADTSGGDVLINVAGSFGADNEVKFQSIGDGQINVQALRGISLNGGIQADANFISFNNLSLGNGSEINGQLYANGNMWIGKGTQISGLSVSPNVPEPATLGLLLLGFVMLFGKHRRRLAM